MNPVNAILAFDNVTVTYRVKGQPRPVLRAISFCIQAGECYGLVGESGCGKSTIALAALRYLPRGGAVQAGHITLSGQSITNMSPAALRTMRARDVSMVYQDAGRALNPSMTIGSQLIEAFTVTGMRGAEAEEAAHDMLMRVQIEQAPRVMRLYPHQLSGGMQQRVVIAMALAPGPRLLILDEPTTGLDATVEAEILGLLSSIRAETAIAMLFISHDLSVIESMCDRVGVLYAGEIVEEGAAQILFSCPSHPYTAGLLACLPANRDRQQPLRTIPGALPAMGSRPTACIFAERCYLQQPRCLNDMPLLYQVSGSQETGADAHLSRCHFYGEVRVQDEVLIDSSISRPTRLSIRHPVLAVKGLSKSFHTEDGIFKALHNVSFDIGPGETLGLVGESGSGKSTLAKLLLGLEKPDTPGSIAIDDVVLADNVTRRSAQQIRALQVVFQNPDSALNRSWTVRQLINRSIVKLSAGAAASPPAEDQAIVSVWQLLRPWRRASKRPAVQDTLKTLMDAVRLPERFLDARAAELSGGLKQRVAIARAFAGTPRLIVCDEPTSALDVSVQAAILNLLSELQYQKDVSYLFISHDLDVVRYLANRIAVLYKGRIVEIGAAEHVLNGPHHPYTAQLLDAAKSRLRGPGTVKPSGYYEQVTAPSAATQLLGEGCPFYARCALRIDGVCDTTVPPSTAPHALHRVDCHLPLGKLPGQTENTSP